MSSLGLRRSSSVLVDPKLSRDGERVPVQVAAFECEHDGCSWEVEAVAVDAGRSAFDHECSTHHSVELVSEFQETE